MNTSSVSSNLNLQPLVVNADLVWDYEIPSKSEQSEGFKRWYIARVLARGRLEDLKAITLPVIYQYFPQLNLPQETRQFWEWYLNLPEVQQRCANPNSISTTSADRHWAITAHA